MNTEVLSSSSLAALRQVVPEKWIAPLVDLCQRHGIKEIHLGENFLCKTTGGLQREKKAIRINPTFDRELLAAQIKRDFQVTIDPSEIGVVVVAHEIGHLQGPPCSLLLSWINEKLWLDREHEADQWAIEQFLRLKRDLQSGC